MATSSQDLEGKDLFMALMNSWKLNTCAGELQAYNHCIQRYVLSLAIIEQFKFNNSTNQF